MTLDGFRPLANRLIQPFIAGAKRAGLGPNAVTALALVMAGAAAVAFYAAGEEPLLYLLGAFFVVCNGLLDLLDGALARDLGVESRAGDVFDHVLDRYADILIIAGLAAGVEEYAIGFAAVTGVLMTSYLGTQAQAVDLDRVYGGALGRADRLALIVLVAVPAALVETAWLGLTVIGWLLVVFAIVGHVTALQRFYYAVRELP